MTGKGRSPRSGGAMCHRQILHGTSPATVPGARTRKMKEPMVDPARFIRDSGETQRQFSPIVTLGANGEIRTRAAPERMLYKIDQFSGNPAHSEIRNQRGLVLR